MRFGPSAWATVRQRVAVEDAEAHRLAGEAGEPFELGHRDAPQVEGPLGPLGEADDDEPEPVLAGLVVLLDEAAPLERGQEPRRGGLVEAEAPGELGHPGLPGAVAEGEEQGRRPVDRADGVAVEGHRTFSLHPLGRSSAGLVRHRALGGAPDAWPVGPLLERRVERRPRTR